MTDDCWIFVKEFEERLQQPELIEEIISDELLRIRCASSITNSRSNY